MSFTSMYTQALSSWFFTLAVMCIIASNIQFYFSDNIVVPIKGDAQAHGDEKVHQRLKVFANFGMLFQFLFVLFFILGMMFEPSMEMIGYEIGNTMDNYDGNGNDLLLKLVNTIGASVVSFFLVKTVTSDLVLFMLVKMDAILDMYVEESAYLSKYLDGLRIDLDLTAVEDKVKQA